MSRLDRHGLHISIRTPGMKLIRSRRKGGETDSLYDLDTDPGELRPVFSRQQRARSKTARERFEILRALLELEEARASEARAARVEGGPLELPDGLEERLRALGYLECEADAPPRPLEGAQPPAPPSSVGLGWSRRRTRAPSRT